MFYNLTMIFEHDFLQSFIEMACVLCVQYEHTLRNKGNKLYLLVWYNLLNYVQYAVDLLPGTVHVVYL